MKAVWKNLLAWYRRYGRELPWRGEGVSGYGVVVSEFMLQQTQVPRVAPLYERWMRRFPDWRALARARRATVVKAWSGLGYNLRAIRLHEMAKAVVREHGGELPRDPAALRALKGIGPYTERAIRAFVFRERVLAPDTNVRRVLARLLKGPEADPGPCSGARAWKEWEELERAVPAGSAYEVNQALMDLGAAVCAARKPECDHCPLRLPCRSSPAIAKLDPGRLPKQKPPRKERLYDGLPNRIYRGRVIERIRKGPVGTDELFELGLAVRPGMTRNEMPWFMRLLDGLEKDGLLRRDEKAVRLA